MVAYATVMVHVDVDGSSDARIRLAATLADRFMATLIGISSCILPPYPTEGAYFVTPELIEEERRDMAVSLKRVEAAFRRQAGPDRTAIEWRSAIEVPDDCIAANARSGDLLVIARDQGSGGICRTIETAFSSHSSQSVMTLACRFSQTGQDGERRHCQDRCSLAMPRKLRSAVNRPEFTHRSSPVCNSL